MSLPLPRSAFHRTSDVRTIGTETQGGCKRHSGEIPILIKMKTAPIGLGLLMSLLDIELVKTSNCETGRGIVADIPIHYSADDFHHGIDPFLREATKITP